ncbi:BnaUnng01060D [Brassica napus]|uniref:BnaUnng01060D protein n=1 Tax=Brassica napus TaxID=3708 RepID=A0A078JEZ1_BRANA|nr:BnaUnng01060D [Brassica napus]
MIFLIKYLNKSSKSLKLMERGVKHVCVHRAD